ncbi:dihydrolipoyl dehydrogenase [Mycoplasma sp. U97]|uniref:dihydrolipoyl dehydrogenase n=1 Tax=Mycoplasma tauri TaxID=547987 RepID=UPI001CBCC15E|nr:dihydrolipoyl dehydrogenase [Mycoplasma tauri]MBZ4212586.1 dihydrolipoyl dehydrogenase [Mycoplasma tauri]
MSECKKTCQKSCQSANSCATTSKCATKANNEWVFSSEGKEYNGHVDAEFDLIIVGSGPGGYLAAEIAGKSGLKTLIVEKEFWGGVCLNIGCIPTKTLLSSIHALETVIHANQYGVVANFEDLKIDRNQTWTKMHERKAKVVSQISGSVKMLMKGSKVQIEEGEAKFLGAKVITVNGKVYKGNKIIIATGSTERKMENLPGFADGYKRGTLITSREGINYDKNLPETLTIVGGGVVGVEFAQVFASAGSKVTIIQREGQILPGLDKHVVAEITKYLQNVNKIDIIFNASSTEFTSDDALVYEQNGEIKQIKSDVTLIATGRIPVSDGLAEVGYQLGQRGEVMVDRFMRTNIKDVYAIGDITGQNMLAHVAYQHAVVAVHHILEDTEFNYCKKVKPVPGCIYTDPEIAFIGKTEEQATMDGDDFITVKYPFSFLGKAIAANKTVGFIKLIVQKDNGHILGAHIIGPNATDYISEIALAMEKGACVRNITATIHPHPTFSEIIWEAARSAEMKLCAEHSKETK